MELRRVVLPLPFVLAALVLTAGCVTVRPYGPVAPEGAARGERVVRALPLGPLPTPTSSPSPPPSGDPDPEPEPEPPRPPAVRHDDRRPPPRRAADRPAPPPERRAKPPAPPRKRPGAPLPDPGHGYDMASLCEAAKGTVSPAIVALCH
ncbi:hypothetical protein ABZ924_21265 [Streptomyces sp. NPDC046876]|uniref:hypothetical protein n=1 Tax=Streptomyces sp. NPDC046876 TaxID=3155616 RepID=UPI0033D6D2D0